MGISFPFLHQVLESGLLESLQDFRGRESTKRLEFPVGFHGIEGDFLEDFHGIYLGFSLEKHMGLSGIQWGSSLW